VRLAVGRRLHRCRQRRQELRTVRERPGEGVHRPGLDEPLDRRLLHRLRVDSLAEVIQPLERPALRAGADDLLPRPAAPPPRPRPLIAGSPKTMLPFVTVKSASPRLTSGGSTCPPNFLASAMWSTSMSRLLPSSISLDSSAAMNSGV